jgi:hypothetical protein
MEKRTVGRSNRPLLVGETHVHYDGVAPLLPHATDGGIRAAAQRAGVSSRSINRWKRSGLIPFYSADKLVAGLGEPPAVIWPESIGMPDADWEQSILLPGQCGRCGNRVCLVRDTRPTSARETRFVWVDPVTRRPCEHPSEERPS